MGTSEVVAESQGLRAPERPAVSRRIDGAGWHRAYWLVLAFLTFSTPLGRGLNAAAVLLAGALVVVRAPETRRTAASLFFLSWAVILYSLVEIANPNVPDLLTGILGFRKTATVCLGVLLGISWPRGRYSAHQVVFTLMGAVVVVSVALHLMDPVLELAIVDRGADYYSSVFAGERRAQGVLAGPFHLSMASAALFASGLARMLVAHQIGLGALSALTIGGVGLLETSVRTGFVAALSATVFLLALALYRQGPAVRNRWIMAATCTIGIALTVASVGISAASQEPGHGTPLAGNAALDSLFSGTLDDRFIGRLATWRQSIDLIGDNPIVGWGSGSAGDTLDDAFIGFTHVTSHNFILKYGVEGGLPLLTLWLLLLMTLAKHAWKADHPGRDYSRTVSLLTLSVFGLTGSAVEAIPISVLLTLVAASPADE